MQRTLKEMKRILGSGSSSPAKGNTIKKATPMGAYSDSIVTTDAAPLGIVDRDMGPQLTDTLPSGYLSPAITPVSGGVGTASAMSAKRNGDVQEQTSVSHAQLLPNITEEVSNSSRTSQGISSISPSTNTPPDATKRPSSSHARSRHRPSITAFTRGQQPPQTQPTLNLLLGQQDQNSHYFTQRHFHMPDPEGIVSSSSPARQKPSTISVPELDPHAFELYNIYMHTGKVRSLRQTLYYPHFEPTAEYAWQTCWPLMNAHILGCIIDETEFADRIMDVLTKNIPPNTCADRTTITHLFSDGSRHVTQILMKLIVDRCVDAGADSFKDLSVHTLPPYFMHSCLEEALRRLSHGPPEATSDCRYHIHQSPEDCYLKKLTPSQRQQESRFQSEQELSRKDAAHVLENIAKNGIIAVDWDQRRAYENPILVERARGRWINPKTGQSLDRVTEPIAKQANISIPQPRSSPSSTRPTRSGKMPLKIAVPTPSAAIQGTGQPSPNAQLSLPKESVSSISVVAELHGSPVSELQSDGVPEPRNISHEDQTTDLEKSVAGPTDASEGLADYKKWPGAYPESELGNE